MENNMQKTQIKKIIILSVFVLFFLLLAFNVALIKQKSLLKDAYIEKIKTIKLYDTFLNDVLNYTKERNYKVLEKNVAGFLEYIESYSTPNQQGASSKFLKETRERLRAEVLRQMELQEKSETQKEKESKEKIENIKGDLAQDKGNNV